MSSEHAITTPKRWVDTSDKERRDVEAYIEQVLYDNTRQRPSLRQLESMIEIDLQIKVSHMKVRQLIQEIGDRSLTRLPEYQKIAAEEIIISVDAIHREAIDAWQRSKGTQRKTSGERWSRDLNGSEGVSEREGWEEWENVGDPRFLREARLALQLKARISGVEAPSQHQHVHVSDNTVAAVMRRHKANDNERASEMIRHYLQEAEARAKAAARSGDVEEGIIVDDDDD